MSEITKIAIATGGKGGIKDNISGFEDSKTLTVVEVRDEDIKEDQIIPYNSSTLSEEEGIKKALLVVKESPDIIIAESFGSNVLTVFNLAGIEAKSCQVKSAGEAMEKYFREKLSSPLKRPETKELKEGKLKTDMSGGLIQRVLNVMGAKLNKLLDHLEEPEEQLAYMEKRLQERRKRIDLAIRDVITDRNLIKHKLGEQEEGSSKEVSLERKLQQANRRLEVLKEKRQEVIKKMDEIKPRMEELKSEWKATRAESKIAEALYGLNHDFGDLDLALDRIEEKIKKEKALADASADMLEESREEDEIIEIEGETENSDKSKS